MIYTKKDLEDPYIARMIGENHYPKEQYTIHRTYGVNRSYLESVRCQACEEVWPCHAIKLYRSVTSKKSKPRSRQQEGESGNA